MNTTTIYAHFHPYQKKKTSLTSGGHAMGGQIAPHQTTTITSSLRQIPPLPQPCKTHLPPPSYPRKFFPRATSRRSSPQATIVAARAPVGSIAAGVSSPGVTVSTPEDIVRAFYDGMNQRDFASVAHLIAEDCVYEDLIFSEPFVGRKAIIEYFEKFLGSLSSELKIRIDDLPAGDSTAVGLTWHFEWQGKAFPFSRGCSFYRLDLRHGKKQIVYGRDCVEPAIKAGELTLVIIQGVVWILRRFPQLANSIFVGTDPETLAKIGKVEVVLYCASESFGKLKDQKI